MNNLPRMEELPLSMVELIQTMPSTDGPSQTLKWETEMSSTEKVTVELSTKEKAVVVNLPNAKDPLKEKSLIMEELARTEKLSLNIITHEEFLKELGIDDQQQEKDVVAASFTESDSESDNTIAIEKLLNESALLSSDLDDQDYDPIHDLSASGKFCKTSLHIGSS